MENKGFVSVIMPTYNREKYIERAVNSILLQTYSNFELIIVDDASVDNTDNVINGIKDPRIKYIKHDINKGACSARNTGIKNAIGQYIAFQDSDDEWEKDKLEVQVEIIEKSSEKIGVVYGNFKRIFQNGNTEIIPWKRIKKLSGNILEGILLENYVSTQVVLLKRECFEKIGYFDESLMRFQDWDLFIRIAKEYEFYHINKNLVNVYDTVGNISSNKEKTIKTYELFMDKYKALIDKQKSHNKIRSYHYFTLAKMLLKSERSNECIGLINKSMRYSIDLKKIIFYLLMKIKLADKVTKM